MLQGGFLGLLMPPSLEDGDAPSRQYHFSKGVRFGSTKFAHAESAIRGPVYGDPGKKPARLPLEFKISS